MSYIPKRPKDTSWRKMVTRQQISDVLSYGYIVTTRSRGKSTQKHLEKVITLSKEDTLVNKREVASIILGTTKYTKKDLLKKVFSEVSEKYKNRNGGYSRLLKMKEPGKIILTLV